MSRMTIRTLGYRLIPEGTYIFKVAACEDKYEDFGKVIYTLQMQDGRTIKNKFTFVTSLGEVNETAAYYWSVFAHACLNLPKDEELDIDFNELVGCYVKAEVIHTPGKKEGVTWANVSDKSYTFASGFDGGDSDADLDDFLNT